MRVSYNWLREFLPLELSPEALADVFIRIGLEVDGMESYGALLHDIRTAKIEQIDKHPNADKLVITSVFDGTNHHQIVTGATNISVGDIVPLSVPGSVIANGMQLKAAKLRGVDSFGMLCSETELGVATASKGIWILPNDTPLGVDFISYAYLKDTVYDLAVLPNRSDCMSHYGIARELGAALNLALFELKTRETSSESSRFSVSVSTPDCPFYSLTEIQGISTTQTPLWMQRRLEVCNIRSINLLVDITNYVLLELGQPLHAFDADRLTRTTLNIRKATHNEPFVTLDGETRLLRACDCVVTDTHTPLALAGVMGGQHSGVLDNTRTIVLEAALFDPITTRQTANAFGLRTESAVRFEKQVDPDGVLVAVKRATYLYQNIAGAGYISAPVTYYADGHPVFQEKRLLYSHESINAILGTSYSKEACDALLNRLGFVQKEEHLIVPSWRRHACTTLGSLAEEIARIGGFDAIPSKLPSQHAVKEPESPSYVLFEKSLQTLIALGLLETSTFPMISPQDILNCRLESANLVTISNPLTPEQSVMRPSLLPSLAKVAAFNTARQAESCRYVEAGRSFRLLNSAIVETDCLAILLSGLKVDGPFESFVKEHAQFSFYDAKNCIEQVLKLWSVKADFLIDLVPPYFHPKQASAIVFNSKVVGYIGTLHPAVCKAYAISDHTVYAELFTSLLNPDMSPKTYRAIPKFPSTRRDIAFSVSKTLSFSDISAVITKHKPDLVREWFLFDLFESESLGTDQKSMAFGFVYQDPDQTLNDERVNTAHSEFCKRLQEDLPLTIR